MLTQFSDGSVFIFDLTSMQKISARNIRNYFQALYAIFNTFDSLNISLLSGPWL